jgi:hypothetical protein
MTHKTTCFRKLNGGKGADIDIQVAPLVKFLNGLGAETVSSCQGDPGPITGDSTGGRYGHVAFVIPGDEGYSQLCELVFKHLTPMYAHLYDDVILEVHSDDKHFEGWLRFRNEAIDEITKRLGCWVEMLHK